MQREVDGEEDNEESTEVTRKKKGAIATKENLTAKKLALLRAKKDRGITILNLICPTVLRATLVNRLPHSADFYNIILYVYMTTLSLQNRDPQTPPAKKQKESSDTSDEVVIDLGKEKRDGNLKELLIRMEKRMKKMEKRQVQIDGKLDRLKQYLKNGNGACGAAVKKEEVEGKFVVS